MKCYLKLNVILLTFICQISVAAPNFDQVIVFGDSLSDTGNIFRVTNTAHRLDPVVPVIPDAPYYQGRFSNGPVWIEYLTALLGLAPDKLVDYAYGNAWAEEISETHEMTSFSLAYQVKLYLMADILDFYRDSHLYVVLIGGNDYVHGRDNPDFATDRVIADIEKQIEFLIAYGARQFFIPELADVSKVPFAQHKAAEFRDALSNITAKHNTKLRAMIARLRAGHPQLNVYTTNTNNALLDIIENAHDYGITNTNEACYNVKMFRAPNWDDFVNGLKRQSVLATDKTTNNTEAPIPCSDPDAHMFWDQLHPTTHTHKLIAEHCIKAFN